ncbi:MAG TPA: SDR family oxidoreductase, partial [Roseiarcus sp.]
MNERFNGKVAIVTGAASGIGRAVAERFFKEGASVFAVDRNSEMLAKLPPAAERWQPHLCDVAAKGATAPLIEACVARFGDLDVLANIAGVGNSKSAHDTSDEDFDFWINANLSSTFRLCRDALPQLRKRRGNILNMASGLAIVGMAKQAAYTSAKAGIAGLTRQMAAEYGPEGIRVNAVAPG